MPCASLIANAHMTAINRFAPGPAAATHSMSRFGLRNLPKFTGTGLAQPNAYLPPLAIRISAGINMVPIGSM